MAARSRIQMRLDAERWSNQGGSLAPDVAVPPLLAISARG